MSNQPQLYDVVIFGTDLDEPEFRMAADRLAQALDLEPERVEAMLREPGTEIRRGVSAVQARQWQQLLLDLDIRCNYRPSAHSGSSLELMEVDEYGQSVSCPACGHVHEVEPGYPPPDLCERCGVVFRKFRETRNRKIQRDQIKRQLEEKHQRALKEQEQAEAESLERKRLEAQIRRELGLPRFVTTRLRMASSALLLCLLGVVLGIGGSLISYLYWSPCSPWRVAAPIPSEAANSPALPAISPSRPPPASPRHGEKLR